METNEPTTDPTEGEAGGGTAADQTASVDTAEPQPDQTRRLVRLPDQGPLAGVAAGLGAYFGVDPVIFRIGFVLLAFAGGSGLVLYALGWLLIPEGRTAGGPAARPSEQRSFWIAAIALGLAWLFFAGPLDRSPRWWTLWALVLIVIGVVLFQQDAVRRRDATADGRRLPPPPGGPAQAMQQLAHPAVATAYQPPSAAPQAPPAPPKPPSALGRATVGAALVASGAAAVLNNVGVITMTAQRYVALWLIVVGAGLVVGGWWGRARGLIVVGILLLPLLMVTSAFGRVPVGPAAGTGERSWHPQTVNEIAPEYEVFAGRIHLDLTAVDFSRETVNTNVGVGFGELLVSVPPDVTVDVSARMRGAGEIDVLGRAAAGVRPERSLVDSGTEGGGRLRLMLQVGFGQITVRRVDSL